MAKIQHVAHARARYEKGPDGKPDKGRPLAPLPCIVCGQGIRTGTAYAFTYRGFRGPKVVRHEACREFHPWEVSDNAAAQAARIEHDGQEALAALSDTEALLTIAR